MSKIVQTTTAGLRTIDNGDGTYVLNTAQSMVNGTASSGSTTTIVDATKNFKVNSLVGSMIEIVINGYTYTREILSNTATTITFDTLVTGVAATAAVGTGTDGTVNITAASTGTAANSYTVQVVKSDTVSGNLSATFSGTALIVTLGNSGTSAAATKAIGSGANGTVNITCATVGAGGNSYTATVDADLTVPVRPLSAVLTGVSLVVSLATEANAKAVKTFGSGTNGVVSVESDTAGTIGNLYTLEVIKGKAKHPSVSLLGYDLKVELPEFGSTATVMAALINAVYGTYFTATASGSGADTVTATQAKANFASGTNKLKTTSNTATMVAAAVDALAAFTATASGTGATSLSTGETVASFTGGSVTTDNAKNTATLVAAAIDALTGFVATASGTGASVVANGNAVAFSGGVDAVAGASGISYSISEAATQKVKGSGTEVSVTCTRPNDTTAYAIGDVCGESPAANMAFTNVSDTAGNNVIIAGASLEIDVAAIPSGMSGFRLHLYTSAPTAIADNAAFNLIAADRAKYIGNIPLSISSDSDLGDTLFTRTDNVNIKTKLDSGSTTLYGVLETRAAFTPSAQTVKKVKLHVLEV